MLITKKVVSEANALAQRHKNLDRNEERKINKNNSNHMPNFVNEFGCNIEHKSLEKYLDEIDYKVEEDEFKEEPKLLQKLDDACLDLVDICGCEKNNLNEKYPTHSFLVNWKAKYAQSDMNSKLKIDSLQHTKIIGREKSKYKQKSNINEEKLSIFDAQAPIFSINRCWDNEEYTSYAEFLITDIQTSLTIGAQALTVDEIVSRHQINFCAYALDYFEN